MNGCQTCTTAKNNLFCNIPCEARAFLEASSIPVEYTRGATLFHEGDRCDSVYILCSGRAKLSTISREGRILILRIAQPGDVLGLSSAFSGTPHELTAEAIEPCHVRVLPSRKLNVMLEQFAGASLGVARTLAADYRAAFEEVRLIALPGSPAGRLARLLLDWAAEARQRGRSSITMPLTHDELASMTATTRETVTRTLSRLRKDGIITTRGVALTVLRPAALEHLCAC